MTDAAIVAAMGRAVRIAPLSQLRLSALNARTIEPGADEIEALAAAINPEIGLLQNLVGRPEGGAIGVFAGGRRLRALWLKRDRGLIPPDYGVPILVRVFSDAEALKYSTIENDRRSDLTILEQADAYAALIAAGDTVDSLAVDCGHTPRFVRCRVALHHRLAPGVRAALADGRINLGQAEAFTVGDREDQDELLRAVIQFPHQYRPPAIKSALIGGAVPLSRAIFDVALYTGGRRRDFFDEEDYVDDRAEFARLQRSAAEARVIALAQEWAWAELCVGAAPDLTKFVPGAAPAEGGAIVHLKNDLSVAVHTGLARPAPIARTVPAPAVPGRVPEGPAPADGAGEAGAAPPGAGAPPPLFTRDQIRAAKLQKSQRLQLGIARNPCAALPLAILALLGVGEIDITPGADPIANPELDRRIKALPFPDPRRAAYAFFDLWERSERELVDLLSALVARHFATWPNIGLDLGDTPLAIAVADAVNVERPSGWTMTAAYLESLGVEQLRRVAAAVRVPLDDGMDASEIIDRILLAPELDTAWSPPELHFGPTAALVARVEASR